MILTILQILSEESWDRLIQKVKRVSDINNAIEDEKDRNRKKRNHPIEFEYDDSFYVKLLNYLEEEHYLGAGFHYNKEYDCLGEETGNYTWWIEDRDIGGTFPTLKKLADDVLKRFLNVRSRD